MEYKLNAADFAEHLYNLPPPAAAQNHRHAGPFGAIRFAAAAVPGIHTVALDWRTPANKITLTDPQGGTGTVNVCFQLKGEIVTRFAGISHPLHMKAGSHNLVYLSEQGDTHTIEAAQQLSVLQLTIDKAYFMQCLGDGDGWSDEIRAGLHKNKPFAACEKATVLTPRMQHLLQNLQTDAEPPPVRKLLFQSRLLELLALQMRQYSVGYTKTKSCADAGERQKLYGLRNYIAAHFLEDLTLTGLSRVSCLNEFKLKKGFKSEFGETVFGYVRKLRMEYAAKLLHDTAQTVDEVADALGYEHAHHFSKSFKDYTGFAPTAYRHSVA